MVGGGSRGGLRKSSGRFATNSASVMRDSPRSPIWRSNSMDSTRLNRLSTEEISCSAILVMSLRTRVKEELGPRTKRTITLPKGSLLRKTLCDFLLLSAKPSRRVGCEYFVENFDNLPKSLEHLEHLENLPKSRKFFGIPRPSPRGVACLVLVFPLMVCLTKGKSLWKPNSWIITFIFLFRFLDVITPWNETRKSLSIIRGFSSLHIFKDTLSSGLEVLGHKIIFPETEMLNSYFHFRYLHTCFFRVDFFVIFIHFDYSATIWN